jgi:LysR family transcriptional regulator, glycine cleavage system transcriptional activator
MFRRTFLPPMAELMAFEAVARHQNVSRAADELSLTQSAVSRQIRQLEDQLGLSLFHRVRQRLVLTDAGRVYASQVHACLEQLSTATQTTMAHNDAGGMLNLAVLPTLAARWLIPRLGSYTQQHPDVTVHFHARTEPFAFAGTPLDAAIHFGDPVWTGAVCEFLMREEVVVVCSVAFQQQHDVRSAQDLCHEMVLLQQTSRPTQWAEWFEMSGIPCQRPLRGPRFEHFAMMAEAALAGLGVALLPRILIESELQSGALVMLSPLPLVSAQAYHLVYPEERAQHPVLLSFRAWLQEQVKSDTGALKNQRFRS